MIYIAEMQMLLSRAFLSWATCATGSENATLSLPAYIVSGMPLGMWWNSHSIAEVCPWALLCVCNQILSQCVLYEPVHVNSYIPWSPRNLAIAVVLGSHPLASEINLSLFGGERRGGADSLLLDASISRTDEIWWWQIFSCLLQRSSNSRSQTPKMLQEMRLCQALDYIYILYIYIYNIKHN